MSGVGWFIVTIAVIGIVVGFALSLLPSFRSAGAYRFARSVGLNLPLELESLVAARLTRRMRGGCAGALFGLAVGAVALEFWIDVDAAAPLASLFLVGAVFTGYSAGAAIASLTTVDLDADRMRVARARAIGVPDLLAPIDLVGARIMVAAGALVAIATIIFAVTTGAEATGNYSVTIVLAGVGLVTLAAFEVASRRLVRRPQPAGTPTELVWDDAIRASLLRALVTAPLAFGSYATLYAIIDFVSGSGANYDSVMGATLAASAPLVPLLFLVPVVASVMIKPQRHFARRLWPVVPSQGRIGN